MLSDSGSCVVLTSRAVSGTVWREVLALLASEGADAERAVRCLCVEDLPSAGSSSGADPVSSVSVGGRDLA